MLITKTRITVSGTAEGLGMRSLFSKKWCSVFVSDGVAIFSLVFNFED